MSSKPKRCIIWVAVSSEAQATDDKESVADQLRRQRERANRNGWLVIDEIVIEGFSRRFYTYQEFAEAAAEAGHKDALRMFGHWQDRSFDILSCRDLSRLGREQSILSEVVARTIDIGAIIMPLDEAPIDASNYRMSGGISGIMSAQHVDSLKRGRNMGMIARAGRGEKIGRIVPMFYLLDATGKLYPDRERFQRLFDDIADLFLAGTPYEQLPGELANRGHFNPVTGKRFDKTVFRRLMITARTWGNAEFNRTGVKRGTHMQRVEFWMCGRGEPPPDVYFKPNVIEPLWPGIQGEDMKDELERRYYAIHGAARPHNTYALSGLCVCGQCGEVMVIQRKQNPNVLHEYVACTSGRKRANGCTNNRVVRFAKVMEVLDLYIARVMDNPEITLPDANAKPANRIPAIDKDIEKLTKRIANWIEIQGDAAVGLRSEYQAKIDDALSKRDLLQAERVKLVSQQREHEYTTRSRVSALESLRGQSVWTLPPTTANQILRKVLSGARVVCEDGEVIGLRG